MSHLPWRALVVPQLVLTTGMASWALLAGRLLQMRVGARLQTGGGWRQSAPRRAVLLLVVLVGGGASVAALAGTLAQRPEAARFARLWDMQHTQLRTAAADGAARAPYTVLTTALLGDTQPEYVAPDPKELNFCIPTYYGLDGLSVERTSPSS